MSDAQPRIRIDKWLWHARFFKTRGLAAKVAGAGHCRVNSQPVAKPAHLVGPGDVLTFPQSRHIRVIRILATGVRRGPASEAQALYEDLDPPKPAEPEQGSPGSDRVGRPTKRDRRALAALRGEALE